MRVWAGFICPWFLQLEFNEKFGFGVWAIFTWRWQLPKRRLILNIRRCSHRKAEAINWIHMTEDNGSVALSCGHGAQLPRYIKGWQSLDYLSHHQLLKNEFFPWSLKEIPRTDSTQNVMKYLCNIKDKQTKSSENKQRSLACGKSNSF